MENKVYDIRVLPVLKKIKNDNGVVSFVDNLTNEETTSISCLPVMLWNFGTDVYFAELPLTYRGSGINEHLFYMYDWLTDEEKEKYFNRTMIVKTTRPEVTKIYNTTEEKKGRSKTRNKKNK